MATATVRRAITRLDIEALVQGVHADRPLPPAYLVVAAASARRNRTLSWWLIFYGAANGFMVALPDLPLIRTYLEALVNEEGEALALIQPEQAQAETVRGRHLGPSRVLLVDLPWAGAEHFVKTNALRLTGPSRPGYNSFRRRPTGRSMQRVEHLLRSFWASAPEGPEKVDEDEPPEPAPPEPEAGPTPTPFSRFAARGLGFSETLGQPGWSAFWSRPWHYGCSGGEAQGFSGPRPEDWTSGAPDGPGHRVAGVGALRQGRAWSPSAAGRSGPWRGGASPQLDFTSIAVGADAPKRGAFGAPCSWHENRGRGAGRPCRRWGQRQRQLWRHKGALSTGSVHRPDCSGQPSAKQCAPGVGADSSREYIEKRIPLQAQRLLQTFAALTAFGWEQGFRSGNTELHGFASRLLLFIEQTALDSGKTQLGYLLSGYPDPSPLGFTARRAPGLKTFSRLTPLQWMAANLAYLKDLDYAETRIAQLGTTRPPKPSVPDPRSRCHRGGGQAAKPRIQMQALKGGRGLWFRSCQAGESGQLFLQPGARS